MMSMTTALRLLLRECQSREVGDGVVRGEVRSASVLLSSEGPTKARASSCPTRAANERTEMHRLHEEVREWASQRASGASLSPLLVSSLWALRELGYRVWVVIRFGQTEARGGVRSVCRGRRRTGAGLGVIGIRKGLENASQENLRLSF